MSGPLDYKKKCFYQKPATILHTALQLVIKFIFEKMWQGVQKECAVFKNKNCNFEGVGGMLRFDIILEEVLAFCGDG